MYVLRLSRRPAARKASDLLNSDAIQKQIFEPETKPISEFAKIARDIKLIDRENIMTSASASVTSWPTVQRRALNRRISI